MVRPECGCKIMNVRWKTPFAANYSLCQSPSIKPYLQEALTESQKERYTNMALIMYDKETSGVYTSYCFDSQMDYLRALDVFRYRHS